MRGSRRDSDVPDEELDPTGVRALLANLPDPGPMPDDLVARISQSLELEQRRRARSTDGHQLTGEFGEQHPQTSPTSGDHVVSLSDERHRRRTGRTLLWLGGAAAVALVGTVSVNQLLGDTSFDSGVSARYPAVSESAGEDADGGAAQDADSGATADDGSAAGDDSAAGGDEFAEAPEVAGDREDLAEPREDGALGDADSPGVAALEARVLTVDGTVLLTDASLTERLESWVAARHVSGVSSWTSADARDCISRQRLSDDPTTQFLVSDATWEEQPAMLLVEKDLREVTAWVVDRSCDQVLTGPVALD